MSFTVNTTPYTCEECGALIDATKLQTHQEFHDDLFEALTALAKLLGVPVE